MKYYSKIFQFEREKLKQKKSALGRILKFDNDSVINSTRQTQL